MTGYSCKKYFEKRAGAWVADAYGEGGYNYPLARERARIVLRCTAALRRRRLKILDLGCGGGDVAFLLAAQGHMVVGVDRSRAMLKIARGRRLSLPKKVRDRTSFVEGSVGELPFEEKFDVIIAMGLIGYLKNDTVLFAEAKRLLKPRGHLLLSCRNRLFNMSSLTFRTKKEIKVGNAIHLINEIQDLYKRVPAKEANAFIRRFKQVAKQLPARASYAQSLLPPSKHPAAAFEPRQQTPLGLKKTAAKAGFAHLAYFGVNPHLIDPNVNRLLPPRVFYLLSSPLEALEHLPVGLVWSSVFVGVFRKRK